jgi:tetratricopeptide (TPR) repeat protein
MDPRTRRRSAPRWAAIVAVTLFVAAAASACGDAATPGATTRFAAAPMTTVAPSPPAVAASPSAPVAVQPDSRTQALIEFLAERVKAEPDDGDGQLRLGLTLLQRIRETADPSLYKPAEAALTAARRLLPDDPQPLVGLGGLQLGRHEFAVALATGRAALKLDPTSVGAGSIQVDALIELGRYDAAFAAADRLAAQAPDLTTLARLSYSRELRGDLDGALAAMQQAADSPSLAPENTAFALSVVGHLQRLDGDPAAARSSFERALELVPGHAPSLAGLGRLAVGVGDLDAAATYFDRAAAVVPLAEYVIALGETREAAADLKGAHRQYDLARAEILLFKANGVAVDLDLALFEADHGNPQQALALARSAYAATPTVRAADAVAWSLLRLGRSEEAVRYSHEALRLGTRDPLFLYHAGAIEAARGEASAARDHLTAALATDPGFSATGARNARTLLDGLDSAS